MSLNSNTHHCKNLQEHWNQYGQSKFAFKILDVLSSEEECLKCEQSYFDGMDRTLLLNTRFTNGSKSQQKRRDVVRMPEPIILKRENTSIRKESVDCNKSDLVWTKNSVHWEQVKFAAQPRESVDIAFEIEPIALDKDFLKPRSERIPDPIEEEKRKVTRKAKLARRTAKRAAAKLLMPE